MRSKPHFLILDGLRGVAALTVVAFHIFEANAVNPMFQFINHGYLAVDFFFLLSGFVISYAYDDRWKTMTTGGFFQRRLVRLQPMVIMGMAIGALLFYFGDSAKWPGIHDVPVWQVLLVMLVGFTLIPLPPSMDIRGWEEMHPLNGPGWSLFFEYIANILYALVIRKASKIVLSLLVAITGIYLAFFAVSKGDMIGGWALTGEQLQVGFTRLLFPFFAGILLARCIKIKAVKSGFLWSSLLLLAVLFVPRLGDETVRWVNGLYEAAVIIVAFPLIVYIGANGEIVGNRARKFCSFLGAISYPIYITHFPLIYVYTGWRSDHPTGYEGLTVWYSLLTFVGSIAIGYASLRWYDEPIRKWLQKKIPAA